MRHFFVPMADENVLFDMAILYVAASSNTAISRILGDAERQAAIVSDTLVPFRQASAALVHTGAKTPQESVSCAAGAESLMICDRGLAESNTCIQWCATVFARMETHDRATRALLDVRMRKSSPLKSDAPTVRRDLSMIQAATLSAFADGDPHRLYRVDDEHDVEDLFDSYGKQEDAKRENDIRLASMYRRTHQA